MLGLEDSSYGTAWSPFYNFITPVNTSQTSKLILIFEPFKQFLRDQAYSSISKQEIQKPQNNLRK